MKMKPARRRVVIGGVALVLVLVALAWANAGAALIVEDPLQPASAIVVFGGKLPFRAMQAATLYSSGSAPQVWLTQGSRSAAEIEMERLGFRPTLEHVYSQAVLERMGVPASAIHVLPSRNNNTASEVRTIAAYARAAGASRVILVTSSYHSRRVRSLWNRLVGERPEAVVRITRAEPFDAHRWWADAADALTVSREWFGLLNAWLGFPMRSEHW